MLVLSRRIGEEIYIGDNILIKVRDIDEGVIDIGIEAPRAIPVHRGEVYHRIQRASLDALRQQNAVNDVNR